MDAPPCTYSVWPVMEPASSESRGEIAAAISSGISNAFHWHRGEITSFAFAPWRVVGPEQFGFCRPRCHCIDSDASVSQF